MKLRYKRSVSIAKQVSRFSVSAWTPWQCRYCKCMQQPPLYMARQKAASRDHVRELCNSELFGRCFLCPEFMSEASCRSLIYDSQLAVVITNNGSTVAGNQRRLREKEVRSNNNEAFFHCRRFLFCRRLMEKHDREKKLELLDESTSKTACFRVYCQSTMVRHERLRKKIYFRSSS